MKKKLKVGDFVKLSPDVSKEIYDGIYLNKTLRIEGIIDHKFFINLKSRHWFYFRELTLVKWKRGELERIS